MSHPHTNPYTTSDSHTFKLPLLGQPVDSKLNRPRDTLPNADLTPT
jgi:hypothetical protein